MNTLCPHGNKDRSFIRQEPDGRWICRQCHQAFATMTEAIATGAGVDITPEPEKSPLELLAEKWESSARSCRRVTPDPFCDNMDLAWEECKRYDVKAEIYEECAKQLRELLKKEGSNEKSI